MTLAFSRVQNLLILTCNVDNRTPSKYFEDINIKQTFSLTSHITVYETCALQYKFYKELEFAPVRENAIQQAEADVSLVKSDYIIKGKID